MDDLIERFNLPSQVIQSSIDFCVCPASTIEIFARYRQLVFQLFVTVITITGPAARQIGGQQLEFTLAIIISDGAVGLRCATGIQLGDLARLVIREFLILNADLGDRF